MKPHRCVVCSRAFLARRKDAKTCSGACRKKLHYRRQSMAEYTLHGLSPAALATLDEIRKVSETAYKGLYAMIESVGATITEAAIFAAYNAAADCVASLEQQSR